MRQGDWLQTATGRRFWPLDPRPDEVCLEDIAHALSLMCRFGGHCREFYSVAEHSVRLVALVPVRDRLAGLFHDAAEAYVVDVPRPLKRFLAGYKSVEGRVHEAIAQRFGLDPSLPQSVLDADEVMLATEARDLMGVTALSGWPHRAAPLSEAITPWPLAVAKRRFLDTFVLLSAGCTKR